MLDGPPEQVRGAGERLGHEDRVELDRGEARGERGADAGEDVGQAVAAREAGEVRAVDGVERDVHAVEPGGDELVDALVEADRVGRQRERDTGRGGAGRPEDVGEVAAHERLAAREPDVGDPEPPDRDPHDPPDLVGGEQRVAGDRGQPFGRHAVGAAQRALLGDRDAQVARDTAVPVDERSRPGSALGGVRGAVPGCVRAHPGDAERDGGHGPIVDGTSWRGARPTVRTRCGAEEEPARTVTGR